MDNNMNDAEYDSYFNKIFKEHTKGMEDHSFLQSASTVRVKARVKRHALLR
jgi:hypothetical protein